MNFSILITLVGKIPIYLQDRNHKAIKSVTEKLIKMLNINIDFSDFVNLYWYNFIITLC